MPTEIITAMHLKTVHLNSTPTPSRQWVTRTSRELWRTYTIMNACQYKLFTLHRDIDKKQCLVNNELAQQHQVLFYFYPKCPWSDNLISGMGDEIESNVTTFHVLTHEHIQQSNAHVMTWPVYSKLVLAVFIWATISSWKENTLLRNIFDFFAVGQINKQFYKRKIVSMWHTWRTVFFFLNSNGLATLSSYDPTKSRSHKILFKFVQSFWNFTGIAAAKSLIWRLMKRTTSLP